MDPQEARTDPSTPAGRQELVRRYGDGLYRWAWARSRGDVDMAGELVQRVFLEAFERPRAYDASRGNPWGWLVGLALNHLRALRRERGRRLSQAQADPIGEGAVHPMEAEESRGQVRLALTSLPPGMQHLLEEHDMRGRPLREIAQELGTAPSTLFDGLCAARGAFRKALGDDHD